jgi:hypothetical protein
MSWLAFSLVASVILTIVLNVALRLFPGAGHRLAEGFDRVAEGNRDERNSDDGSRQRVRVFFPWKAMLIGSLLLTVAINVALIIFR